MDKIDAEVVLPAAGLCPFLDMLPFVIRPGNGSNRRPLWVANDRADIASLTVVSTEDTGLLKGGNPRLR